MVFAMVTMVVVLLSMLAMYSIGQLTTQKMKLQNTADAVAYSVALVEARDLNYSAYMNRAMIANQVAVGQIVSLTGWIRNADDTYNGKLASIATTIANLSPMSSMWTVPANAIGRAANAAKSFMDSAGPVMVQVLDLLMKAFSLSAKAYHLATIETVISTSLEVRDQNDKQAEFAPFGTAQSALDLADHIKFASSFDPTANKDGGQDRFAKVVDASSDLFYKNRTLPLPLRLTPSLIDPARLVTPGLGPLLMLQFHSGGTVMATNDRKSYVSADATGLFVILCLTIPILGIPFPIPIPLPPLPSGAGAAAASGNTSPPGLEAARNAFVAHRNETNTGGDSAAAVAYGAAWFNPMTAIPYYIKAGQGPGKNMHTGAGLQSYMDISANANSGKTAVNAVSGTTNRNDKGPPITIEMERSADSISTTSSPKFRIGGGDGGALHLKDDANAGKIRAVSKAQTYFSRPKALFPRKSYTLVGGLADDKRTEYGSLYSPYWSARLVPLNIADQALSIGPQMLGV